MPESDITITGPIIVAPTSPVTVEIGRAIRNARLSDLPPIDDTPPSDPDPGGPPPGEEPENPVR